MPSVNLPIWTAPRRNLSCRPLFEDVSDQRRTGREFEPPVNVLEVGAHGAGTDEQPLADLGIGQALSDQAGHLLLPNAQPPQFMIARRCPGPTTQLAQHGTGTIGLRFGLQAIQHLKCAGDIRRDDLSRVPGGGANGSAVKPSDRLLVWHAEMFKAGDGAVELV